MLCIYSPGHPIIRKVWKIRIWVVPPSAWAVGSYSSGPPSGGTPQILIFKTYRTIGRPRLYIHVKCCPQGGGFNNRGGGGFRGGRGGPRFPMGPPMFNPQDVFMWLDLQNPMLLQQVNTDQESAKVGINVKNLSHELQSGCRTGN